MLIIPKNDTCPSILSQLSGFGPDFFCFRPDDFARDFQKPYFYANFFKKMFEYISGKPVELSPAHAVVDVNGIGYFVRITVHTYEKIAGEDTIKLYTEFIIRDDGQYLYGFADKAERQFFRRLIAISGVGTASALSILSAVPPDELAQAIIDENIAVLKAIKGIGPKTAKRIVVELKDKLLKEGFPGQASQTAAAGPKAEEAIAALEVLGYPRRVTQKPVQQILREHPGLSTEQIIKLALKRL